MFLIKLFPVLKRRTNSINKESVRYISDKIPQKDPPFPLYPFCVGVITGMFLMKIQKPPSNRFGASKIFIRTGLLPGQY